MGAKGKEAREKPSPVVSTAIKTASEPIVKVFEGRTPGAHLTSEQKEAIVMLLAMCDGNTFEVQRLLGGTVSHTMIWSIRSSEEAALFEKREEWKRQSAVVSQRVFAKATAVVEDKLSEASPRDAAVIAGIYADKGALFAGDNVTTVRHLHGVDPVALGDVLTRLQSLTATSIEEAGDLVPGTFTVKD